MEGHPLNINEMLEHVSGIKRQFGLAFSPGGSYRKGQEPPLLPAHRPQRIPKGLS